MSSDPFANTTTVKNILNHIISPKIVKDGSAGYTTKTDLVNIDNLIFASRGTTAGSEGAPLTAQCGTLPVSGGVLSVRVFHSRVTVNSVILVTQNRLDTSSRTVKTVTAENGSFVILLTDVTSGNQNSIFWFIASF
jgi:hypothetical protein